MEAIKAKVFALKLSAVGSLLATGSIATAFVIPAEAPKGWQEGLHTAAICTIVIGGLMSVIGKMLLAWIKADEDANAVIKPPIVTTTISMVAVIALASVLSGCAVSDHVSGLNGTVSVDPVTGAVTVGGNVSIKKVDKAVAKSNAILSGKPSIKTQIQRVFYCPPSTPPAVAPLAPYVPQVQPVATQPIPDPVVQTDEQDSAILSEVLANNEDETPRAVTGDRAVVFGNNYPGTDAELHQCVNDAYKVILYLVKYEHFSTKSIHLFRNQQCTKANYEKWSRWAMVDGTGGRRWWSNSSHGSEDTDESGKVVQLLVTDDMVRKGVWDSSTEVTFDYWYQLLRSTQNTWIMLNDSCHSGGQARPLAALRRGYRSLDGPPAVQARLARAITVSSAMRDLGTLPGTIFPVCRADQLASEGPNGGVGTDYFIKARQKLPVEAKAGDVVREVNALMRSTQETQNMILIGQNKPLWAK